MTPRELPRRRRVRQGSHGQSSKEGSAAMDELRVPSVTCPTGYSPNGVGTIGLLTDITADVTVKVVAEA